jgi:hypothetical protein
LLALYTSEKICVFVSAHRSAHPSTPRHPPIPTPAPTPQVEVMQHELKDLQPVLAATADQVEGMMGAIAADKEEAAATRLKVRARIPLRIPPRNPRFGFDTRTWQG